MIRIWDPFDFALQYLESLIIFLNLILIKIKLFNNIINKKFKNIIIPKYTVLFVFNKDISDI